MCKLVSIYYKMVLKVETEPPEETKPILESNASSESDYSEAKLQEAYRHLSLSMKAGPLSIDKPIIALNLFSTAVKVQNVPLAKQCIEILNNHLNNSNVLLILRHMTKCISEYKNITVDPFDLEPSAPPIVEEEYEGSGDWVQDLVDNLRNNCLLEIDKNADLVMKQKEILNLTYCDILTITTRDSLQVSSEILVYSTIMKWCIEECKRRTLETHPINLKAVLRQLIYAPRYGLMTKKEFLCRTIDGVKGPDRSGMLDEAETERILEYIRKKGKNKPLDELPHKGGTPRKAGHEKPWKFQSASSKDSNCSTKSSCDKFIINFLTCWTAVFD
ncbi:uncharacterized protein LOC114330675 isoform X2 [Diabrotica virgifera virgifera]|uniref:Uncharacterized protein LOC114330675 isoform X1 n=1 Tax=Diabrotica virgifera virgifera TaxID=50390 RepID=A0A6P7FSV6_DIAVI|nr:uncharacterized protein LOC114330675 isoform X2 [Diabrotica virgifera virgifera]